MRHHSVSLYRVFGGLEAFGNETGVVICESGLPDAAAMQAVARALDVPDTVFLAPVPDTNRWQAKTYSPYAYLNFCVQGLLAAGRAFQDAGRPGMIAVNGSPQHVFTDEDRGAEIMHWSAAPEMPFRRRKSVANAEKELDIARISAVPGIVEAGRDRLFLQMENVEALENARISASLAASFLERHGIDGLCLYCRESDAVYRMRVFTTSLAGGEDSATGGAAAALAHIVSGDQGGPRIVVRQGAGGADRRGEILVSFDTETAVTTISGEVLPVMRPIPEHVLEMLACCV